MMNSPHERAEGQLGECEAIFELFEGPLGRTRLGRLYGSGHGGRLVTLRPLRSRVPAQLLSRARQVAHPRLTKVLGLSTIDGAPHLVSEYIEGASVFELLRAAREKGSRVDPRVAVRVVLDALKASSAAKELLQSGEDPAQGAVLADALWIAHFGETLLMDAGVSACVCGSNDPLINAQALGGDVVFQASVLLDAFLSNRATEAVTHDRDVGALPDVGSLPPELGQLLLRFAKPEPGASAQAFIADLEALPRSWIAQEMELGQALTRHLGPVLELRRHKLLMLERDAGGSSEDESEVTRFFTPLNLEKEGQHDTVRPAAPDAVPAGPPESPSKALTETANARSSEEPSESAEGEPEIERAAAEGASSDRPAPRPSFPSVPQSSSEQPLEPRSVESGPPAAVESEEDTPALRRSRRLAFALISAALVVLTLAILRATPVWQSGSAGREKTRRESRALPSQPSPAPSAPTRGDAPASNESPVKP
ncbi:MAG TPA: hypothetical protein VFQ61_33275 [Polyangiaceae bacterium]|nr:hypothetical protein [Polyangiaceae bacterium]